MLLVLTLPEKPENQFKKQEDLDYFKHTCTATVSTYTILKRAIIQKEFGNEAKPVPTIFYERLPTDDMEHLIKQALDKNVVITIAPNFYANEDVLVERLLGTLAPNIRAKYEGKLTTEQVKLVRFEKINDYWLNFSNKRQDFENAGFIFEAL